VIGFGENNNNAIVQEFLRKENKDIQSLFNLFVKTEENSGKLRNVN